MNSEENNQLLRLLIYFREFFDGTLRDWDTDPLNLELNPYSKMSNCKYYPFPRVNKETFRKDLNGSVNSITT